MKTILILLACVCGAISVLYAAVVSGAAQPPVPTPRHGIAAFVDKAATPTISLEALAHHFTAVNTNLVECNWE